MGQNQAKVNIQLHAHDNYIQSAYHSSLFYQYNVVITLILEIFAWLK